MSNMLKEALNKVFGKKKERFFEPSGYKIGVTTGIPSFDRATVVQQTQMVVSKGTKVIQVDLEYPQSPTPHDIEEIKRIIKAQGLELTIHAATNVTLPTTSAEKIDYELVDKDMKDYVKLCKKVGFKAINVHSSYLPSPFLMREYRRLSWNMVDENGDPIGEKLAKSEKALEWFVNDRMEKISFETKLVILRNYLSKKEKIYGEELDKKLRSLSEREMEKLMKESIKDYYRENPPTNLYEFEAYMIMAWWMYERGDELWRNIAGGKPPDKCEEKKLVDAVAGKYLQGHIKKLLKDLEDAKVILLIENPDCRRKEFRGYHRLEKPIDIFYVVKSIDHPLVRMTIDFEHVATHGLNVEEEIKKMPQGSGEYVKMLHVGSYPSPAHLHHPVERDDVYLYRLMWHLRERGFKEGYIIFEWGGGRKEEERWLESVNALKWMAMWLERDVAPDDLPPEFFG
ncbi:MAG TPA: hypothetical protein ENF95_00115, partial [Candidatus Aenigmarchaeota archaeon]|nr:hypothetical protein [Candidatus Aenigmarchaeota archaeon]